MTRSHEARGVGRLDVEVSRTLCCYWRHHFPTRKIDAMASGFTRPIFTRDLHERWPDSRTTEVVARPVEGLQSAWPGAGRISSQRVPIPPFTCLTI